MKFVLAVWCFFLVFSVRAQNQEEELKDKPKAQEDTISFVYRSYRISDNNHKVYCPADTVFEDVNEYATTYKKSPSWTRLTNLGQAALNNLYFEREEQPEFIFWQPYQAYWGENSDQLYYQVNKPFTDLRYTRAQRNAGYEQSLSVDHIRQVNEKLNIGLNYSIISTPGIKGHRNDVRHNQFRTFASYNSLRYQLHANVSYKKIKGSRNGGFVDDGYYFDIDSVTPELTTASDRLYDLTLYADHEYLIGSVDSIRYANKPTIAVVKAWASLRHRIEYKRNYRVFEDEALLYYADETGKPTDELYFYPQALVNSKQTFDSMYMSRLRNHFELEVKEGFVPNVNFGLRAGLLHEYNSTFMFRDYFETERNKESYQSVGFTAGIFNRVSDYWAWDAKGEWMFLGYKQNDLRLKGELNRYFFSGKDSSILQMRAKLERTRPNYYMNSFFSNHYAWENSFDNEERMAASLAYIHPKWKMELRVNVSYDRNFVYLSEQGIPTQESDIFLNIGATARKRYSLGNWGFETEIFYQKSSNESVLHIPEFVGHQSVFFDKELFNNALRLQIGFDVSITSRFKAQYFNPALGAFQLQNEVYVGNFPDIDGFLNLRVRNARLFFKYNNLYQSFNNEWFFTSAKSIDSYSLFRFGVYWHFKN